MKHSTTKPSSATKRPVGPFLVILGPQGAGKGTQSILLAEKFGLEHIEMGAMLRSLVKHHPQSALAKKVARYMNEGKLAPFSVVVELMEKKLAHLKPGTGVVFDGFPRHVSQMRSLLVTLKKNYSATIDGVILLSITKKESIRRLSNRVVCQRCHRSWTIGRMVKGPHVPCPHCGGTLVKRADDQPEAILKRLAVYERDTKPVATYFTSKKVLHTVRGERPVKTVFHDVSAAFLAIQKKFSHE